MVTLMMNLPKPVIENLKKAYPNDIPARINKISDLFDISWDDAVDVYKQNFRQGILILDSDNHTQKNREETPK